MYDENKRRYSGRHGGVALRYAELAVDTAARLPQTLRHGGGALRCAEPVGGGILRAFCNFFGGSVGYLARNM